MRLGVLVLLGALGLGVALVLKLGPDANELERVYALAMSPTMVSVPELEWASALLARAAGSARPTWST